MLVAILATAFAYQAATGSLGGRLRPARSSPATASTRPSRSSPSGPSSWPSPSRCRCSRSTPGCRTPTWRRPPPARSSWPASCSSSAATASSASPCRSSRRRPTTFAPLIIVLSIIAHHLRRDRGPRPAGPQEAGRLQLGQPHGLRDAGHLRLQRSRGSRAPSSRWSTTASSPAPSSSSSGVIYERTHDRDDREDGRPRRGRPRSTPRPFGFFVFASRRPARPGRLRRRVPGLRWAPSRSTRGPPPRSPSS